MPSRASLLLTICRNRLVSFSFSWMLRVSSSSLTDLSNKNCLTLSFYFDALGGLIGLGRCDPFCFISTGYFGCKHTLEIECLLLRDDGVAVAVCGRHLLLALGYWFCGSGPDHARKGGVTRSQLFLDAFLHLFDDHGLGLELAYEEWCTIGFQT